MKFRFALLAIMASSASAFTTTTTTTGIHTAPNTVGLPRKAIILNASRVSRTPPVAASNHQTLKPQRALEGVGMPSKPGWKSGRLDRLTDWVVSTAANRPVICEYDPNAVWLWTKWTGTVLPLTIKSVLVVVFTGLAIDNWARSVSRTTLAWPIFAVPPATNPLIQNLKGLRKLWEYQVTLGTFVLSFFTSQSYSYWQKVYNTARAIQGRINDIGMLITVGAQRTTRSSIVNDDPDDRGGSSKVSSTIFTEKAARLVELCSRLIRVSHTFFWAATPTSSNGLNDCDEFIEDAAKCPLPVDDEHIGPLLLSPYGLKALVKEGQLTQKEADALLEVGLPPSQYAYVLLVWVGLHAMNGIKDDILSCDSGFEENLLRQLTALRASYFDIDDFRAGRMPLAYVHLVQVLVDSLVILAPFALYPELGILSVPLAGLLTMFFKGLLELSKSFLDPFGVEGYPGQNIRVDVLVSELNFGLGARWINAGKALPV